MSVNLKRIFFLVLTIGVIALAVSVYFILKKPTRQLFDFVPSGSFAVFRFNYNSITASNLRFDVAAKPFPFYHQSKLYLSLLSDSSVTDTSLLPINVAVSIVPDTFHFITPLFIVEFGTETKAKEFTDKLIKKYSPEIDKAHHEQILHFSLPKLDVYWSTIGKIAIYTPSQGLLFKSLNNKTRPEFVIGHGDDINRLPDSDTTLQIFTNDQKLPNWFVLAYPQAIDMLPTQGSMGSLLEYKRKGSIHFFTGTTFTNNNSSQWINLFEAQKPLPLKTLNCISNSVSAAVFFNLSDFNLYQSKIKKYCSESDGIELSKLRSDVITNNKLNIEELITNFTGEVVLALSENVDNKPENVISIYRLSDADKVNSLLQNSIIGNERKLYSRKYSHFTIFETIGNFNYLIMGPPFPVHESAFYAIYNNLLIVAGNAKVLKTYIDDLVEEDTWAGNYLYNKFLANAPDFSSIALIINPRIFVGGKIPNQKILPELSRINLPKSGFAAIFTSYQSGFKYKQTALAFEGETEFEKPDRQNERNQFMATGNIEWGPFAVPDHISNQQSYIFKSDDGLLTTLNHNFKTTFSLPFNEEIISKPVVVDYYNNRKYQYAFSTKSNLYLIDRNGNPISGFPIEYKNFSANELYVFDYSGSYRFMVSASDGNTYLFGHEGNLLDGWNPLQSDFKNHTLWNKINVNGRDILMAHLPQKGIVQYSRIGKLIDGFPVGLNNASCFLYDNKQQVCFVPLTNGQIKKLDLDGKVFDYARLKTVSGFDFEIIDESNTSEKFLSVVTDNGIDIYDSGFKRLFSFQTDLKSNYEISVSNFEKLGRIFSVYQRDKKEIVLINELGQKIWSDTLMVNQTPYVVGNNSEMQILFSEGRKVATLSVR